MGDLAEPAIAAEVSNPACGDTMRLSIRWEDGRVAATAFRTRGCTASIAAGSVLTEWLLGRTRDEVAQIQPVDIEAELGGLPPASRHAAALCCDAVKAVLLASPLK